jgi:hypothetical protein
MGMMEIVSVEDVSQCQTRWSIAKRDEALLSEGWYVSYHEYTNFNCKF